MRSMSLLFGVKRRSDDFKHNSLWMCRASDMPSVLGIAWRPASATS
jgi:hypothetical protein